MLQLALGLSTAELQAISELEQLVVAADGGRLKPEWGTFRSRSKDEVEDLLWWENDKLVGYLGLYSFGEPLEIAGMVAPVPADVASRRNCWTPRRRYFGTEEWPKCCSLSRAHLLRVGTSRLGAVG